MMNTENLGELFAAMAMARQEFAAFTKSKTATIKSDKGSYGYNYADLSDIIEATAPALAKHGLVIIQEPEVVNEGARQTVVISGCIAHKSGAVYHFRPLPLPVAGNTAQAIGSAISYARRYQLSALFNLAASDDDGQSADAAQDAQAAQKQAKAPAKAQSSTPTQNAAPDAIWDVERDNNLSTVKQTERIHALGNQYYGDEWGDKAPQLAEMFSKGAVKTVKELMAVEADKLIKGLEKKLAEPVANGAK